MTSASFAVPGRALQRVNRQEWVATAAALAAQIDELEAFKDPEAALRPAAAAESAARELGRVDLELRARLVRADALGRSGEIAVGGRMAHELNRRAAERGDRHLLARSHRVLAWFFGVIGDTSAHLEHAVGAVDYLDEQSPAWMRCEHLLSLGVALGGRESWAESRLRFQMAGDIAVALGDVDKQLSVLCNLSCTEDLDPAGEPAASMAAAEQMVALATKHSIRLDMTCLDTLARAQMGLRLYADAEQTLLHALSVGEALIGMEADSMAHCLLTLAGVQRLMGATDRARITLDRCQAHCEERGLAGIRARLLQERAEVFALDGDYREAFEQHKMFYAEASALESAERDVRARTLQAVFETDEARRDSLRFREMSLRDPLTGLYNRRFVDARLDALLKEATASGATLSVGLVDLDHFKLVNDTLSHEIGDRVLVQIAALLGGGVTEPAFVARLGGEEFLVVLPGAGRTETIAHCEDLRVRVRSHAWGGLTGELAITASIGVASVTAGHTTRSALLADADRNLYAAKRAGRDRVAGDLA